MNDPTNTPTRFALVRGPTISQDAVAAYMPDNYMAVAEGEDDRGEWVLITGIDLAGWTMVDYVRPRLSTGLFSCTELVPQVPDDRSALDSIAALLDQKEWDSDTPDDVARIIRSTGRPIRDIED